MMNIDKFLEIVIPTYNRAQVLKKTLTTLLLSPVGNCKITVIDNNSTDETSIVVKELTDIYTNLNYTKNRYNLGLAGNICKALTVPEKKYFWIVFDDTGLDFSGWESIEKGLDADADCILTANYYNAKDVNDLSDKAAIFLMLIYCFSGIYKTDLITESVILYAITDIYTVHPQMALISKLFNNNKKIYLPEKSITFPQINPETKNGEDYSFNRNSEQFFHFRISNKDFIPGFVCAIQSLHDDILKKRCIKMLFENRNGIGPYTSLDRKYILNKQDICSKFTPNYLDEMFFCGDIYSEFKDSIIIEDNLDIFIITYNRCDDLEKTLYTITDIKSPIRNCTIKILDNNSNDRTAEICYSFTEMMKNIIYIKNNRNIGLSGNICRAMELAEKKYFWILCDNDEIKFDAWNEIEQAIKEDYDLILASRFYFPEKYECFESLVLNQLTFLPSGIYKTKYMTDDVMCYAMLDTWTILPHMALGCNIINRKGRIFLPSKSIVNIIPNRIESEKQDKYTFDRLESDDLALKNPIGKSVNFYNGIAHSFLSVKNKKILYIAMKNFIKKDYINGYGPFLWLEKIAFDLKNKKTSFSYVFSFLSILPNEIKIKFLKIIFRIYSYGRIINIYTNSKGINVQIFQKIKIRIWKRGWLFFK